MKIIPAPLYAEKNAMEGVNPWIWLIEINPSGTEFIFITNDNAPASLGGNTYDPFPFVVGAIDEDITGGLPRLGIQVSSVTKEFSRFVDRNLGFIGQDVLLRLCSKDQGTGTVTQAVLFKFKVEKTIDDAERVTFLLGNDNLNDRDFPSKRIDRDRCSHAYSRDGTGRCDYKGTFIDPPTYVGGGSGTMTGIAMIAGVHTESIVCTWVAGGPHWTVVGPSSGTHANAPAGAYDNGLFSATFGGSPNDGDTFTLVTENLDTCDQTAQGANGCVRHQNIGRFGGEPGIPRDR